MMSREIKFRAWHKGYPVEGTLSSVAPHMVYERWSGECFKWKHEGQPVEIMQYTGLHDRNGKEIYEGDVVRTAWDFGRSFGDNICQVSFREGEFVFDVTYETEWIRWESITSAEIIGNIHEHPHLISELPGR